MKWVSVLGIAAVLTVMYLYEWPRIPKHCKREKITFLTLSVIGGILSVSLVFHPDMPGFTQLFNFMYRSLMKWIGN